MEVKNNKSNSTLIFFISFAIILAIAAIVIPILIFNDVILLNISDFNEIGDAFGGIVNPMIAAVGVSVTFLAFYIQYQANQQQLKQINQSRLEQNDLLKQQMFFRLMDNQQQRIFNLTQTNLRFMNASPDITGVAALDSILINSLNNKEDLTFIGKEILSSQYDILTREGLFQILDYGINKAQSQVNDLNPVIDILMGTRDYDLKLQTIKGYIHPLVRDNNIKSILDDLGFYYFYAASDLNKREIYSRRYKSIASKNQTFIDGYIKGFEHIINLLKGDALSKDDTFVDYLKYNLTISEQKILFLYFASGNGKLETKAFVLENNLLLDLCNEKFLSNHENYEHLMKKEIKSILSIEHLSEP